MSDFELKLGKSRIKRNRDSTWRSSTAFELDFDDR